MPAPISAGVFGMQRTSLRWPPSQRDRVFKVMPAAMLITSLLACTPIDARRALRVLRLDREDHHVGARIAASGAVGAACTG